MQQLSKQALRRWFGVIFWFAVLGIVGAFLYRMVDWLVSEEHSLSDEQRGLFARMQQIMDWPAAQLIVAPDCSQQEEPHHEELPRHRSLAGYPPGTAA